MSYLKNTPVEINEAEVPIEIRRYGLVPDSGGPGKYRGGTGLEMEFQLFAPQSLVTARNRDRSIFSAWGVQGGMAGRESRFVRNPGTDNAIELGSVDVVHCDPGDVILIQGPGAGGYGSPLERPAELVVTDIRRGIVSEASAREHYGLVLTSDRQVDEAATAKLRGELLRRRTIEEFGHGQGRLAYEKTWTKARYDALTHIMTELPVTWRYFLKHQLFAAIGKEPAPAGGGAGDVYRAYAELTRRFTDLPPVPEPHAAIAAE
jgi:N-methylhydantoinase B